MNRLTIIMLMANCILYFQCSKKTPLTGPTQQVFAHTWGTTDQITIENSRFHSHRYLDTISNQLTGDTLIPVTFLGNDRIIIRKLVPTSINMTEIDGATEFLITEAAFLPDTFTYTTRHYIDEQFLILFSRSTASRVYELKTLGLTVPEIRPDYQPEIEIGGYSVGDEIERDQIEIIYANVFGSMVTEEAVLKENPDVFLTIIGRRYIEKIERRNILDEELHALIRTIDRVFETEYEYEETVSGTDELSETVKGYYWHEKEVSVFLQKVENSFDDPDGQYWTLEYSNYIITTMLQNYLHEPPEST